MEDTARAASWTVRRDGLFSAVVRMLCSRYPLQLPSTSEAARGSSRTSALLAVADVILTPSIREAALLQQQLEHAAPAADATPVERQTCSATVQRPRQCPHAQQQRQQQQQHEEGAARPQDVQHSDGSHPQLWPLQMLQDARRLQQRQPQDRSQQRPLDELTASVRKEELQRVAGCCWSSSSADSCGLLVSKPPRSSSGSSSSQSTRCASGCKMETSQVEGDGYLGAALAAGETGGSGSAAAEEAAFTASGGAAAATAASIDLPQCTATSSLALPLVVSTWAGASSQVCFSPYPPPGCRAPVDPLNGVGRSSRQRKSTGGVAAVQHHSGGAYCCFEGESIVVDSPGDGGGTSSSEKEQASAFGATVSSSRTAVRTRDVYNNQVPQHKGDTAAAGAVPQGSRSSTHGGGDVRLEESRSSSVHRGVDGESLRHAKCGGSGCWLLEVEERGESCRVNQQQRNIYVGHLHRASWFETQKPWQPSLESWAVNKEAATPSLASGKRPAGRGVAVAARVFLLVALLARDLSHTHRREARPATADESAGRTGNAASRGGADIREAARSGETAGVGRLSAVSHPSVAIVCRETALRSCRSWGPALRRLQRKQKRQQQQQLSALLWFNGAGDRNGESAAEGHDDTFFSFTSSLPCMRTAHQWGRSRPQELVRCGERCCDKRKACPTGGGAGCSSSSGSSRRKNRPSYGNVVCCDRGTDCSSNGSIFSMALNIMRASVASGLMFASAEHVAAAATPDGSPAPAEAGTAGEAEDAEWEDTFVSAMMLVEKEDNHEAAFPLFADCSMRDDVRCQYELGVYYFLGLPPLPARNFTAAMLLWHVSAWGGSAEAQYALSLMHTNLRDLPVLPAFPPQKWGAKAAIAAASLEAGRAAAAAGEGAAATGGEGASMKENEGPRLWPLVQVHASDFSVKLFDRDGTTDWSPVTTFTEQLQQQADEEQQPSRLLWWLRGSSLSRAFGRLGETLSGWWPPQFGSSSSESVSTSTDRQPTDKTRKKKARKQRRRRHRKKTLREKEDEVIMNMTMRAAVDAGLAAAPAHLPSETAASGSSSPLPSTPRRRKARSSRTLTPAAVRRPAAPGSSLTAPARVSSIPNFASNSGVPMVLLYAAAAAGHPGAMMAMAQRLQNSSLDAPLKQQQACTGATNFLLPLARQVATSYASGIPQAPELLRFHHPAMSVSSKGQQHSDALLLFVPQPAAAAAADWFGSRSGGAGSSGGAAAAGSSDAMTSGMVERLSPSSRELEMLTAVAQGGNTAVQLALGKRYLFGVEGLPQDFDLAHKFLLAAAERGRSEARALLGYMHSLGVGVPRNTTSATLWFLSAVEAADHPVAYSGLGYLHFFGTDLIERNEEVALHFFNISASHGFPDAQTNLASMYISGHGHSQSFVQAMQWYTRALQSGSTGAAYALGLMHLNGLGAVRDCALASSLLKRLVERSGYVTVKLQRAYDLYAQGRYDEAAFLLLLLAEAGLEVAQSDLAYLFDTGLTDLFFDGTTEKQRVHAQHYYEMAMHQGSPLAGLRLGDFAYHGYGMRREILPNQQPGRRYVDDEGNDMTEWIKEAIPVYTPRKVNYNAAVAHYRKVAEMLTSHKWMAPYAAKGSFNLGFMHMYGLGVKQDFGLARLYFQKCLEADPSSPRAPVYVALALLSLLRYKHEADIQGVAKQLYADVRVSLLIVLLLLLAVLLATRRLAQTLLNQVARNQALAQLQASRSQEQRQQRQERRQFQQEEQRQQDAAQIQAQHSLHQPEQQNSQQPPDHQQQQQDQRETAEEQQ